MWVKVVFEPYADTVSVQVLRRNCSDPSVHFEILSNPEFLAEGTAMADLENPDRVSLVLSSSETGCVACSQHGAVCHMGFVSQCAAHTPHNAQALAQSCFIVLSSERYLIGAVSSLLMCELP